MAAFLSWYVIITLLGWLTFPLVYTLFPALSDRGYSLARAAGLLVWGYVFWLFTSLDLTQNNPGGILFALFVLAGLSTAMFLKRTSEIVKWLQQRLRLIITVEVLFLIAFVFLAIIRAGNPELDSTEKPMELMFINSILRSPTFPPHDSWLSGYAISYYYFGYVMTAMLAQLTGLTGSIAHNLMTSLIFALAAIGAYGILYNLLSVRQWNLGAGKIARLSSGDSEETPLQDPDSGNTKPDSSPAFSALLAPLFLLLVSNVEGFLEVLHRAGFLWTGNQNFWTWLGIKDLNDPPALPLGWIPDRFWWWWRASRVISDFDLAGNFREVIDEFPFFSFLLGDLHPHILAIPFNLLAIAIALNLFLGGWRGETRLLGLRLQISKTGFFAAGLTLGGLAFLNTWDILVGAGLIVVAYVLFRVGEDRWSWARLEDVFALGLPLGLLALLLYLPFYVGFSSQAGGILPNLINPTRGAQLWVMFAPFFIPILAYLIYMWRAEKRSGSWLLSLLLVVGFVALLWAFSWTGGWIAIIKDPAFAQQYLATQGMGDLGAFFNTAMSRRFAYIGGLLTLVIILIPSVAFLIHRRESVRGSSGLKAEDRDPAGAPEAASEIANRIPETENQIPGADFRNSTGDYGFSSTFVLLLITLAGLLVVLPEFVFIRDQFASRMNTIFKFYYQAWLLWSLAAAFGTAVLLRNLRGIWDWIFRIGMVILLLMALTYPVLALSNKTNNFNPPNGWTLDDFTRIQRNDPDEAAAILWLRSAPYGTLTEAVGGSYTNYARISEYTGLPAVLGWPGHESQWRGSSDPQGSRQNDMALLYSTPNWETARQILQKYAVRYVYIGGLERSTYTVQEEKFQQNLIQVFHQGNVTIYQVP